MGFKLKMTFAFVLLGLLALAAAEAKHGDNYSEQHQHETVMTHGSDGYAYEGHQHDDEGYDDHGYDKHGFDKHGYDKDGYDQGGYHKDGYDSQGYDKYGFDRHGHSNGGYDRSRYLPVKHGYYHRGNSIGYGNNNNNAVCPPALACPTLGSGCGANSSCCDGLACRTSDGLPKCCLPLGATGCATDGDCCQLSGVGGFCRGNQCVDQTCFGKCFPDTVNGGQFCWLCNSGPCPVNPCIGYICKNNGYCDWCFPASSTVRRLVQGVKPALTATGASQSTQHPAQLSKAGLPTTAAWETVTMPELRVGDFIECVVPRHPDWLGSRVIEKPEASAGELGVCQLYSWKAAPHRNMGARCQKAITFKYPDGSVGTLKVSGNHHFYAATQAVAPDAATPAIPPGGVKHSAHVTTADVVTTRDPATGMFYTLPVSSVTTEKEVPGVYTPYLTKGGLLVVDGVVMYSSATNPQDPENEHKHWGRYYLMAPLWQAVEEVTTRQLSGDSSQAGAVVDPDIAAAWGKSLYELGAELSKEVPLLDKQWYAVAEAAGAETRVDWRGLAKELHTAIAVEGKRVSRADVLRVLKKHMVAKGQVGTSTW